MTTDDVEKEGKLLFSPYISGALEAVGVQAKIVLEASEPVRNYDRPKGVEIASKLSMISKDLSVDIIVSFPQEMFMKIYEGMVGETPETMDDEVKDCAGEVLNMIYGQAKTTLKTRGFDFGRAFPTVYSGDSLAGMYPVSTKDQMLVSFNSDYGTFYLELIVKP